MERSADARQKHVGFNIQKERVFARPQAVTCFADIHECLLQRLFPPPWQGLP